MKYKSKVFSTNSANLQDELDRWFKENEGKIKIKDIVQSQSQKIGSDYARVTLTIIYT